MQGRKRNGPARRAHLVAAPIAGGVLGQVLDLVRFDPLGRSLVVLPPWPGLERAAALLAQAGAGVVRRAPAPRPAGAGDWLAGRPVDLVHVHYAGAHDATPAIEAALGAGIAVVSTDHACPQVPRDERDAVAWAARRALAPRQAALLADSRAVAVPLAARVGVPVCVVQHGIDARRFAALPPRLEARRALGLPVSGRVVGSVGALFSAKGMHRLVEAMALRRTRAVLAIAGEGPERPRLAALAAARGVDLRLLGWQEDVRTALAAFDVFALSSDSEGLPTCILEAMAAGVPVVAAGVPGVAEAVGECGRLVHPWDGAALGAALEEALEGGLQTLVVPARARVQRDFEVKRLAAGVARVHQEALGGSWMQEVP